MDNKHFQASRRANARTKLRNQHCSASLLSFKDARTINNPPSYDLIAGYGAICFRILLRVTLTFCAAMVYNTLGALPERGPS